MSVFVAFEGGEGSGKSTQSKLDFSSESFVSRDNQMITSDRRGFSRNADCPRENFE